jgi:hypothetical protein
MQNELDAAVKRQAGTYSQVSKVDQLGRTAEIACDELASAVWAFLASSRNHA